MRELVFSPLDPVRAKFQTHMHYLRRLEHSLSICTLSVAPKTRSFMLEQLRQEYVTTARVKGLSEARVV